MLYYSTRGKFRWGTGFYFFNFEKILTEYKEQVGMRYTIMHNNMHMAPNIFKERPVDCVDEYGNWTIHPTVTLKGRVVRRADGGYQLQYKYSNEEKWFNGFSGTAEYLGLSEQEVMWAKELKKNERN